MPLVSVIVPIYKIEKYIENCIKSIIRQSFRDLEIILVDDGSPDTCGAICDRYAQEDERIRVIHKVNGGLSDARNAGIEAAAGEYLLFVDGDDTIAESLVGQVVECAQETGADMVMFDFLEVEEVTGRTRRWSMNLPRGQVLSLKTDKRLLLATPGAWNKLYRRTFWNAAGQFFPPGRNYEDLSTIPKLLLYAGKTVYLEGEPLYFYALRAGSIMRSNNFKKSYQDRVAAIEDICHYFEINQAYEGYREELEYLTLEHAYFVPSKEILLADPDSIYMEKFRQYTFGRFPDAGRNKYIKEWMSAKDRLQLWLLRHRSYKTLRFLSFLRTQNDLRRG